MSSMDRSSASLTLPALYARTLRNLIPCLSDTLPSHSPEAQAILYVALDDLDLIARMIRSLGVFSDNELMEDVGDQEMIFMSLGWVRGEVEGRILAGKGIKARLAVLERTKSAYESYLSLLDSHAFPLRAGQHPFSAYHGASSSSAPDSGQSSGRVQGVELPRDPAARREAKIKQYRLEKELSDGLKAALPGINLSATPVPAILALLPETKPTALPGVNSSNGSSSSSSARTTTLLLLSHLVTLVQTALSSLSAEAALLAEASRSAHIDEDLEEEREEARRQERVRQEGTVRVASRNGGSNGLDSDWRLDRPLGGFGSRGRGPSELMDPKGRPTQPFTILPSQGLQNLSDRARLQSEVFRSGHRLPTMTIEEYLQEEERRGNFISGGGPAQDAQLTTSEQLALDAEMDGTAFASEREEEQRQKNERWASYTDEHRKGEGNSMNRG